MAISLDFDELNKLTRYAYNEWQKSEDKTIDDLIDDYLDLLIMCFVFGNDDANTELESDESMDDEYLVKVIEKKVADETWKERIEKYAPVGDIEEIVRVIETDGHRIYSDSKQHTATKSGATKKKWLTMRDESVRETHSYLEGMTIDINDRFYTFDGDSALQPGDFTLAENNVNCRCVLSYTR